jgi:hypothetical protein
MDKNKHQEEQQEKWERSTSTMKKRKFFFEKNTNTKTINRREQVVVSRLRTGYTRTTHASVMNKVLSKIYGRSHPMALQGNRNKTVTNEHR